MVGRLVAIIAAHNEEHRIGAALRSLKKQQRPPDHIVVVADRCTDRTVEIAVAFGAKVFEITDNPHRKAGALNQALASLLPALDPDDNVLLMDADTVLNPRFLDSAERRLRIREEGQPDVGAVGAVFLADETS